MSIDIKGLELAERFYLEHGAPMIKEKFPHLDTLDKLSRIFHCTLGDLLEREMQEDKIEERARLVRLYEYMERLNPNGVEKALTFFEDLNPKFYEVEEDEEHNPIVMYIEDDLEYAIAAQYFSNQLSKK